MPDAEPADRFDALKRFLQNMSGGLGSIGFDNGYAHARRAASPPSV